MIPDIPIPVTLLTGFLGSGKTTLLNHLLKARPLTAVVMNEFGKIALDHLLLGEIRGPMALLSGGCVCCQIQGGLAPTLKNLWLGREDGKLPPFERIVIETTGIADPAPILDTLLHDRYLAARLAMDGVVTTVDAVLGQQQMDSYHEALRQAAMADRLILTKSDLAGAETLSALEARLNAVNPSAPRLICLRGEIDPALILNLGAYQTEAKHQDVLRWLNPSRYRPAAVAFTGLKKKPTPATNAERIKSFSLTFDTPLDEQGLANALEMLVQFRGQHLLRMKALVNLAGRDSPMVLHGVQHIIYPPTLLSAWPDEDRRSRFVFITDGLEPDFIVRLLEDFSHAARREPDAVAPLEAVFCDPS